MKLAEQSRSVAFFFPHVHHLRYGVIVATEHPSVPQSPCRRSQFDPSFFLASPHGDNPALPRGLPSWEG